MMNYTYTELSLAHDAWRCARSDYPSMGMFEDEFLGEFDSLENAAHYLWTFEQDTDRFDRSGDHEAYLSGHGIFWLPSTDGCSYYYFEPQN